MLHDFCERLEPKCDIFGMIGSIAGSAISSGLNYDATMKTSKSNERNVDATNASNLNITQSTNAANKAIQDSINAANLAIAQANNQTEVDLAHEAYEQSTAGNQIKELMKTGMTLQEARLYLLNGGSGGNPMPMPQLDAPTMSAAQMQSANMQPFQGAAPQLADFGAALGSAGSALDASLKDPAGGALGQLALNPIERRIYEINDSLAISKDEEGNDVYSYSVGDEQYQLEKFDFAQFDGLTAMDFQRWALRQGLNDPLNPYFQLVKSKDWKSLMSSPWGRKAWSNFVQGQNAETSFKYQIKRQFNEAESSFFSKKIEECKAKLADFDAQIRGFNFPMELKIKDKEFQYLLTDFSDKLSLAQTELLAHESDEYREYIVNSIISDAHIQQVSAALQELQDQGIYDMYSDSPVIHGLFELYTIFNECGFASVLNKYLELPADLIGNFAGGLSRVVSSTFEKVLARRKGLTPPPGSITPTVSSRTVIKPDGSTVRYDYSVPTPKTN